jgi:catechol 2,3-dioxygenase-like lactoylglutathione lyase family enzyme
MLSDLTPTPALAVADLDRARAFYEGVLGMPEPRVEYDGAISYACGAGQLMVYESQFAGTNKATAMAFELSPESFDAEVARLRGAGVSFLTFPMPAEMGMTWEDDIAVAEAGRVAWFADPDGNIISLGTAAQG